MLLDPETCEQQLRLLAQHRETLAHYLEQSAAHGGVVFSPSGTANGIKGARTEIERIKSWLRAQGMSVEDQPNDYAPATVLSTDDYRDRLFQCFGDPSWPSSIITRQLEKARSSLTLTSEQISELEREVRVKLTYETLADLDLVPERAGADPTACNKILRAFRLDEQTARRILVHQVNARAIEAIRRLATKNKIWQDYQEKLDFLSLLASLESIASTRQAAEASENTLSAIQYAYYDSRSGVHSGLGPEVDNIQRTVGLAINEFLGDKLEEWQEDEIMLNYDHAMNFEIGWWSETNEYPEEISFEYSVGQSALTSALRAKEQASLIIGNDTGKFAVLIANKAIHIADAVIYAVNAFDDARSAAIDAEILRMNSYSDEDRSHEVQADIEDIGPKIDWFQRYIVFAIRTSAEIAERAVQTAKQWYKPRSSPELVGAPILSPKLLVLQTLLRLEKERKNLISPTEIAALVDMDTQLVADHLEALEQEGYTKLIRWQGNDQEALAASMTAKGRIFVNEQPTDT